MTPFGPRTALPTLSSITVKMPMESRPSISSIEYLVAVAQQWKRILVIACAAAIISGAVSFLLPKWYVSSVTVVPPRSQGVGGIGSLSSLLKDFAPVGGVSRLGGQSQPVNYLAILRSRRMAETLIRRYDLLKEYGITDRSMERGMDALAENFAVEVADDGSIRINTWDKDSVRAAQMANGTVDVLNEIAIELGVSEAKNNRMFLERRVNDAREELARAEEAMKTYQEGKRMPLLLSDDARAAASAIGELYARRVQLDIQLSIMQRTTGEDNPTFRQISIERGEVERRLADFPQLGMDAFRLYRSVLIQQKILEFLVPMYEQARFEEQKDVPVVLVLDKAVPAERKDRPRRLLIVAVAAITALLLSIAFVIVRRRLQQFTLDHPDMVSRLRTVLRKQPIG